MKSKNVNYAVLVGVLVVSALLAQLYLRPAQPSLQVDLKNSLDLFWGNSLSQVDLTGADAARLLVSIPVGTPQRQKEWTFPVARWVAARHPGVRLANLTVTDSSTQASVLETPALDAGAVQTQQQILADRSHTGAARSLLLQRRAQSQLDARLGLGRGLALVDADSDQGAWLPNATTARPRAYGKRASADCAAPAPQFFAGGSRITACVVVQHQSEAEQVPRFLDLGLNQPQGDRLRVLVLPAGL